jgi:hypothetical protein
MQPQAFVTLTYPPHFLSTAATIKSYFNHHPKLPVVIIVDDTNITHLPSITCLPSGDIEFVAWPDYISDCEELYRSLGQDCRIVRLSQTGLTITLFPGWLRQQMVKFYIDYLLPDIESWFFSDGDVFFFDTTPVETPYSYVTEYNPQWISYVADTLKINPALVKHKSAGETQDDVTVSNPPWRLMSATVLKGLRSYVETTHNVDFIQYHYSYARAHKEQICAWSEWELIELYQSRVLNQQTQLKFCPPLIFHHEIPTKNLPFTISMLNLPSETAMGRSWFEQMGVPVSDDHWQKVSRIKK